MSFCPICGEDQQFLLVINCGICNRWIYVKCDQPLHFYKNVLNNQKFIYYCVVCSDLFQVTLKFDSDLITSPNPHKDKVFNFLENGLVDNIDFYKKNIHLDNYVVGLYSMACITYEDFKTLDDKQNLSNCAVKMICDMMLAQLPDVVKQNLKIWNALSNNHLIFYESNTLTSNFF